MRILKFGGSSVATPERILQIVAIAQKYTADTIAFSIVFSAFGGLTDVLLRAGKQAAARDTSYKTALAEYASRHRATAYTLVPNDAETIASVEEYIQNLSEILHGIALLGELSARSSDLVVSFGERGACLIIAAAFRANGIAAQCVDARDLVRTDANYGAAKVDIATTYQKIAADFSRTTTNIVTGFIGATADGVTTTLGRGGSDYTAALFAAALDAEVLEIWTDVSGVLTADPRRVPTAFPIPEMSYAEAMEMSHFGAKVIYPPTIQPVLQKNIPLRILNTFAPSDAGTLITNQPTPSEQPIKGISSISQISLITLEGSGMVGVPGTASRLFGSLAQAKINVILITQGSSEHSITFAVMPDDTQRAQNAAEEGFEYELKTGLIEPLRIETELSVVAVIGENMKARTGIAGKLFGALGKNGVNIIAIAQGSSELNISTIVPRRDETKALQALHEGFFTTETTILHLYIVGVGLIGKTLLRQLAQQADFLKQTRRLELRVVGFANSKKMVFDTNGIDTNTWEARLAEARTTMNMKDFVTKMQALNLPNSVFIDNTANAVVPSFYEQILNASISVSTPNKIAASSEYALYHRLKSIANRKGVLFLFETNVGAGLPVLTTLNDLIQSGDRIRSIEGVLSGTLSFIFNNFDVTTPFSEVVREAHRRGYTEPDPREDLSGADVRRKLLILAREAGLALEADDIKIDGLLSEAALAAKDVNSFFKVLENENALYLQKLNENEGKILRFVASLQGETASIGLRAFEPQHPFASLSGSDNMIVFETDRYCDRPLVIRGPGAGAEVTAAGVFAEIIRIASFLS